MKLCKQTMIQSYSWTSFSPEKRGESDFNHYTHMLAEDLTTLGENQGNYESKYIARVMCIVHRQARCASPMITGPANFNNRRNGKAWDSRDNAVNEFNHWRNKYLKAVTRERTLSPEAEIDVTLEEIEKLTVKRDAYKAANKCKTRELREAYLRENYRFGEREKQYFGFLNSDCIPNFAITSLTTKIRERVKKLAVMRSRIETKGSFETIQFNGGYVALENDRVVIKHHEKPSKEVIEVIKRNGFKYSPKTVSWVRKHTENAVYVVKSIIPHLAGN